MITLEDVRKHLADNTIEGDWDDERVSTVLAAEKGAQRSVLDVPSPRPAQVDEALLRRVVHNLVTSTSKDVERCGVHGEGVRELEEPWSRRKAQQEIEPSPKPRRKRAAKKSAATSAATNQKEKR